MKAHRQRRADSVVILNLQVSLESVTIRIFTSTQPFFSLEQSN